MKRIMIIVALTQAPLIAHSPLMQLAKRIIISTSLKQKNDITYYRVFEFKHTATIIPPYTLANSKPTEMVHTHINPESITKDFAMYDDLMQSTDTYTLTIKPEAITTHMATLFYSLERKSKFYQSPHKSLLPENFTEMMLLNTPAYHQIQFTDGHAVTLKMQVSSEPYDENETEGKEECL